MAAEEESQCWGHSEAAAWCHALVRLWGWMLSPGALSGGGGGWRLWECTASPVWCRPNAWAWLWAGRMALQGIAPVLGACCATSRCLCSEPWAIGHSLPCTWRFTHGPARTENAAWCKGFICFLGQTRWYMQLAQNLLGISVLNMDRNRNVRIATRANMSSIPIQTQEGRAEEGEAEPVWPCSAQALCKP